MFGGAIDGCCEVGILARNAGDMDDVLGTNAVTMLEEIRNRQLRRADWMGDIDINEGVSTTPRQILALL